MKWGITGGIGAGKSYVSQILREQFFIPIYDCDSRAKELMTDDSHLREELIKLLGTNVYLVDGLLNKALLADYLFASEDHAKTINAIVHPAVRKDFQQWAQKQTNNIIGIESAILYESGFETEVDKVLYIDAPKELRIQRAMQRDGVSRKSVEQRICRQESENNRWRADFIFENDGGNDILEFIRKII